LELALRVAALLASPLPLIASYLGLLGAEATYTSTTFIALYVLELPSWLTLCLAALTALAIPAPHAATVLTPFALLAVARTIKTRSGLAASWLVAPLGLILGPWVCIVVASIQAASLLLERQRRLHAYALPLATTLALPLDLAGLNVQAYLAAAAAWSVAAVAPTAVKQCPFYVDQATLRYSLTVASLAAIAGLLGLADVALLMVAAAYVVAGASLLSPVAPSRPAGSHSRIGMG
jgi:hypothetical protein